MLEDVGGCWRMLEDIRGCWRTLEDVGGCSTSIDNLRSCIVRSVAFVRSLIYIKFNLAEDLLFGLLLLISRILCISRIRVNSSNN